MHQIKQMMLYVVLALDLIWHKRVHLLLQLNLFKRKMYSLLLSELAIQSFDGVYKNDGEPTFIDNFPANTCAQTHIHCISAMQNASTPQ